MIISLPNGKVVHRSVMEYLFMDEEDVHSWYQNMMADDAGEWNENPFIGFRDVSSYMEEDTPEE